MKNLYQREVAIHVALIINTIQSKEAWRGFGVTIVNLGKPETDEKPISVGTFSPASTDGGHCYRARKNG